uniref:Uncharacterized protein n=1 Tax=Daphnia magna TaxID=35525 RepID=A0A0P5ANJ5_9CRUS
MKTIALTLWDEKQCVRSLIAICQLVKTNDLTFVLANLGRSTERFYERALDPVYQSELTATENLALEREFAALCDWIQNGKESIPKHNMQITTKLQISILHIARYILVKTSKFPRDHHWTCNVVKLALETAICCHDTKLWPEMEWCLNEAGFHQQRFALWAEIPIELRAPYFLNSYLLLVLWLLWIHGCNIDSDEAFSRFIIPLDSMELTIQQAALVTKICFNIGLDRFNREEYETAAAWMKTSYRFAISKLSRSQRGRRSSSKSLFLFAICLYKTDPLHYREKILHTLDSTGDSLVFAELRFRTFIQGKPPLPNIIRCALKMFSIYNSQEPSKLRVNVFKVFNELERNGHSQATVDLLNAIPWHTSSRSTLDVMIAQNLLPHIKWICAEIALRFCIQNHFQSGCYQWLEELTHWNPSEHVDLESLTCILILGQTEAMKLNCHYLALKWFRILVKITCIHGGPSSVVVNAMRYALSLNSSQGLLTLTEIYREIPNSDIQILRFKLLVAVLSGDSANATKTCLELDARNKKEEDLESEFSEEGLYTLEMCALVALKDGRMNEIVLHILDAMTHEIRKGETRQLVRVIRFHLKILFCPTISHLAKNDLRLQSKCIDNLISALINAYRELRDSIESPDGPHDGNGLELWFGNLAWSLGRKLGHVPAFSRHQFFKLSYKMLGLTPEKDEEVKERIVMSITLAVAAGISCMAHPHYRKILKICLDVIGEFPKKGVPKPIQLHFYEFYILCELEQINRMWEILRQHESNENLKGDSNFFAGLAALASNTSYHFLRQVLPPIECHQLPSELLERELSLQVKLTCVAIHCLKLSNHILAKSVQPLPIHRMVQLWKKIIEFSSDYVPFQEKNEKDHFISCEEYRVFISNNRQHFDSSEISFFFNYVWNVSVETRIFKGEKAAQRYNKGISCTMFPTCSFSLQDGWSYLKM